MTNRISHISFILINGSEGLAGGVIVLYLIIVGFMASHIIKINDI